jgi:two-component system, NtrC family, response regulator AtoC
MAQAMPAIVLVAPDAKVLPALRKIVACGATPYPVYACARGAEALGYIDGGGVGCVIADDSVPDIDSLALAQAINERYPALPVALLASRATIDLYDAAQAAGCVAVLSKPVAQETLRAVVCALLAVHREPPRSRALGAGQ